MLSQNQVRSQYSPFSDAPDILRDFLNYMLTIRGRSPRTVDGYYIEIRSFLRYLMLSRSGLLDNEHIEAFHELPIRDVTNEMICSVKYYDVYSYLSFMHTEFGNAACSRARKTTALRTFYRFITNKTELLKENPLENLESPSIKKSLPKHLTLDESRQLLEMNTPTSNEINGFTGASAREFCILTLFLNCGMRLSELVGINCEDIRDDRTLTILGKGNKERTVFLNDACIDAINAYLKETESVKREDNALFIGRGGKRLSPRRVEQLVEKSLKDAGLSKNGITPHKLRHTAATLLYQYGQVDIRVLKELLGHVSLSTTEIYTHVSNDQIRRAALSSPLSQPDKEASADTCNDEG